MQTEHELLFGLLALQNSFISRDQLVAAFSLWTSDKSRSLDSVLAQGNAITESQRMLLLALVAEHLKQHGNAPEKSLAAIGSPSSVKSELANLADPELCATLIHIPSKIESSAATQVDPFQANSAPVAKATSSRFRILRPHATGGLGQVSVAFDEELCREVALKEIKPEFVNNPESRQRFVREAEITGALEHPSIVPIYGLGTYGDGRPYYAMRFIKGDSLRDWISQFQKSKSHMSSSEKGLAMRKLLTRFIDVCQAMQYAHTRGVLHRDLKPQNVMLGKYGETLVVDWGLAKSINEKAVQFDPETTSRVTTNLSGSNEVTIQGSAIGTPAYMSPEQAEGKIDELGPASDVYSLGVTLYHCLTGRLPFDQKSVTDMLVAVSKGIYPKPREIDPTIPKPLESICLKAMQRNASDRYSSAKELADDIENFLADEPIRSHSESATEKMARFSRKHKSATQTAIIGLSLIILLLAGSVSIVTRQRNKARELAESIRKYSAEASFESGINLFTPDRQNGAQELVRSLALADPVKRKLFQLGILSRIEFGRRGQLPPPLKNGVNVNQSVVSTISLDASRIATVDEDSGYVRVWDSLSSEPIGPAIQLWSTKGHTSDVKLAFSPDAAWLAASLETRHDEQVFTTIKCWEINSGKEVIKPSNIQGWIRSFLFVPRGKQLLFDAFDDNRSTIHLLDVSTDEAVAAETEGKLEPFISTSDVSRSGRFSYLSKDSMAIFDTSAGVIKLPSEYDKIFALSSDGNKCLAMSKAGTAQLFRIDPMEKLGEQVQAYSAKFSADGQWLACLTTNSIKLLSAESAETILTIPLRKEFDGKMGWDLSPDTRLLATCRRGEVTVWSTTTGEILYVHRVEGIPLVKFSNNGRFLMIRASDSGTFDPKVRIVETIPVARVAELRSPPDSPISYFKIDFDEDGQRIFAIASRITPASDSKQYFVQVLEAESLKQLSESSVIPALSDALDSVVLNAAVSELIVPIGNDDGWKLTCFDARSGERTRELQTEQFNGTFAFNSASQQIAFETVDDHVRFLDLRTNRPLGNSLVLDIYPHDMKFSSDGRFLFVTGAAKATANQEQPVVKLIKFDTKSGERILELVGENQIFAMSQDGTRDPGVASGIGRRELELSNTKGFGAPIRLPEICTVQSSADGSSLAVGSRYGLQIWNAALGKKSLEHLTQWSSMLGPKTMTFSGDGQKLAVGDSGLLALYDVSPGPVSDNLDAFIELILGFRADSAGNVVPLTVREFDERFRLVTKSPKWRESFREYRRRRDEKATLAAIAESEAEHNWFAKVFHLNALLNMHPGQTEIAERLGRAEGYLSFWNEGFKAMRAEQAEDWRSAVTNLERLAKVLPTDPVVDIRLNRAKEELTKLETRNR